MREGPTSVIPSAARDLVFSATYEEEIPRLHLGMTVATRCLRRGRVGWGVISLVRAPHLDPPPSNGGRGLTETREVSNWLQTIQLGRVLAHKFRLQPVGQILAFHHFFHSVREFRIAVIVVGGED